MRWTRWTEFKKRRKARYDEKSTAAPVNTKTPSVSDGGNGLFLADKGSWDNYPTKIELIWKVGTNIVQFGESYCKPEDVDISTLTLTVNASNDNGTTSITVGVT